MKITGIKPGAKWALLVLLGVAIFFGIKKFYLDAPKAVGESQKLDKIVLADAPEASLKGNAVMLSSPSDKPAMRDVPKIDWKIMAWNSQFPLMYANGGARTTQGSLFDKANVDVQIIRQDDCFKTIADFIKNAKDYKDNPSTTPLFMSFMGDGMPGFSIMLKELEQLGPDYTPIIIYHMGRSNGEDQFMGPASWKENPQNALGGTFSAVELDGDANIVFNWASNNNIPVNVNTKVYDPKALNLIPSPDFLDAANKYITDYKEKRQVVVNGKTTGRDTTLSVNATTTWTPGDVNVALQKGGLVRIASTKEYSSQMPNATIVLKKWAYDHRTDVENIIMALGQAGDQVRSFNEAKAFAAKVSAEVYGDNDKPGAYWLKYYNGTEERDMQGTQVLLGGSMAFNLADAANAVGLGPDRKDRYKVTYETFGNMLAKLYPEKMTGYTPYSKIMDKSFLNSIISNHPELLGGEALKVSYAQEITSEVSSKSYNIQFESGSDNISASSYKMLNEIYSSAVIAEGLKLGIYGHTDNAGSNAINLSLSERRASAVKEYLVNKGISTAQIETKGYGAAQPVSDNTTAQGKAKNRRVEIVLGQ
ncbi:MAG: outer membrane protein precursor [Daejeonella sp.]|nr:outer membrane protein precursor [Daejeonella sp.]